MSQGRGGNIKKSFDSRASSIKQEIRCYYREKCIEERWINFILITYFKLDPVGVTNILKSLSQIQV